MGLGGLFYVYDGQIFKFPDFSLAGKIAAPPIIYINYEKFMVMDNRWLLIQNIPEC